ncbi:hypothetical protein E5329_01185 [Petralouisia muris]|uniref:Uncharacterized protein n=1 Tax=Petralouisia muris TaxID=3032872 RepID=A0AC61S245_9FIRM|nr:hypothetical protein [Petralouisia muris]TGY98053.1 hypothetical protein E5329_01185 [Petralouisia muris]
MQVFKGLDGAQIQNYITQLQAIKASSNGLYASTPVAEYAKAIEGLEAKQAALLLSTQGLTNAQIAETLAVNESNAAKNYQAMADAGLLARKQKLTVAQVQENLQTVLGAEADTSAAMASLGLSAAMEGQGHQTLKLTARKLEEAVATNALTEAQAKELAMRTGVMLSMEAQTASEMPKWIATVKAGTKAVLGQIKATAKWLATTPAGWAAAAIASIGGVIAVINNLEKAEKKESDAAAELFEKSKEKVSSNKEEAESLEELIQKYQELKSASVIDSDAREQIKEIQNDIVGLVGSEAKTLDLVNGGLEEQLSRLKEISSEKARQNAEDAKDAYDNAIYQSDVMTGNADDYGNDVSLKWNGTESTQIHKVKGFEQAKYDEFVKFITNSGFGDIFRKNKDENIFNMRLVVDTTGIDGLEEKVERLKEFKEFLDENGFRNTGMYQGVANAISSYGEQQDSEAEAANNLVEATIQSLSASSKELSKISVDSVKSFEEYRQKMLDEMKNDESIGKILADGALSKENLETAVNDFMAAAEQFSEWYERWNSEIQNQDTGEISTPSYKDSLDGVQSVTDKLHTLMEVYDDVQDGEEFNWSSILNNDDFASAFESAGKAYDDFIQTVTQNSDDIGACQKAFDSLATSVIDGSGIWDDLTAETKEATIAMLEENGVVNASELVNARLAMQEECLALAKDNAALAGKKLSDITWEEIGALLSEGEASDTTSDYLTALAISKMDVNSVKINTQDDVDQIIAIANAAGASTSYIQNLANALLHFKSMEFDTGTMFGKVGDSARNIMVKSTEEKLKQELSAQLEGAQLDSSQFYAKSGGTGGSGSGKSGKSGSSAKEESIETFDFIETAVKRVEAAIERLKTKAEETFRSFTKRGREYKKAISEIAKEIDIQRKGYDAYIAKANSIGLEESWARQVRDGSVNIADVSDDGLKERIKNYKEWYEKALECQEKLEELKKTQKELAREKIELLITKYEKLLGKLESTSKRIQNNMDFKETWGFSASAKDYTKLNKNAKSQIKNLINQNKKLKELQKTVTKGSEAWREYNERINSNNESIQELTQSMAENAIASANLAGQNAEAKNSAKDTADSRTDAKLSTASTASRKNSLLNNKAKNIDARQKNLQTAYNKTAKSRVSYGNKILKANKKDVSKKNKKLFAQAIAKVKAGKLVSASTINGIVNALKSAKGKEYKELNALLSHCISYNANKNAEEENKLNLEMYALTAQEEKKSFRQEQLNNSLDANQSKADRATLSNAETTAAKNQNIDTQTRLSNANANAQEQAAKNAVKDRETAAGKASFAKEKSYKKLKDKKLKKRLQKAVAAIKAGKKIDSDSLKAVKEYCQKHLKGNLTYYYNCEAYNEAVENELSAKEAETLAKAQAYASALQAKREKAANTVSGRDEENELHAATSKNQTSAEAKNQYVDRQISNISQNASTYKSAYNTSVTDYSNAKSAINKSSGNAVINEIKSKYVSKNILIPADYLEKAYAVSNSFGLACSNYNEALEAMNAAKAAADLYEQTAKTEKAALALEKMENIDKDYGHKISVFEQRASRIDNSMDIAQAKGYQASKKYYERLTENEEKTNETLARKRKDLTDSLNQSVSTGAVTKFSDEWYEACGRIDDVTNAIEESAVSLAEFKKQMRQIDWDNFDYLESRIKNTVSETDFLIGELSRESLANEDVGWMTGRGKAAAFLHAGNYENYRKQAEDYASEIRRINSELEKDPYNKELVDRKDELLQSYRECIQAAQEEKYAVIDLYTQGYEALSGKLKNLISDYEDLLDKEKDAFDYQKNIADKAKEIAGIRKRLEAYAGDMSEETRAKIQTLKVSLEEAEKDLQETQYDKYISDTKEMLSDLQDSFDEAIQLIVDSLAENFGKLTEDMEATAAETGKSIMSLMTGIGYAPTEEFGKLLEGTGIAASVNAVLTELKDFHAKMTAYADKIASSANADAAADSGNSGTGANNASGADQAIINAATQGTGGVPKGGAQAPAAVQISGDETIKGKDGQDGKTDILEETGISKRTQDFKDLMTANDYLDKHLKSTKAKRSELTDINKKLYDKHGKKILTTAQMKELAKKLGVEYDNQKTSGSLYKKLKSIGVKGFRVGSKNIPYEQLAFLGEKGDELHFKKDEGTLTKVGQGDMVFTDEMSKRLWEISQMPPEFIREKFGIPSVQPQTAALAPLPPSITENNQYNGGDVNINMGGIVMNGVNDKKEFVRELNNALATNRDTIKIMQHNTVCALGKNYRPMDVMRYVR